MKPNLGNTLESIKRVVAVTKYIHSQYKIYKNLT